MSFTSLCSAGDVSISGGMTFTVNSDLNGESPQFTLTCISTGGPATTVTWTRDSGAVSGGMTVLDDPVTAQYTHTLTVTGRLGGQYQCTVSNNKPSHDSTSLTVQGTSVCTLKNVLLSSDVVESKSKSKWKDAHIYISKYRELFVKYLPLFT